MWRTHSCVPCRDSSRYPSTWRKRGRPWALSGSSRKSVLLFIRRGTLLRLRGGQQFFLVLERVFFVVGVVIILVIAVLAVQFAPSGSVADYADHVIVAHAADGAANGIDCGLPNADH